MQSKIKIYTKGTRTKTVGNVKHVSPYVNDLVTFDYRPDTEDSVEGFEMCKDFAKFQMAKRKKIGISRGVSVPSTLYFSIEINGITVRSEDSSAEMQWKGLFAIPTSKLKSTFEKGENLIDKYISVLENRMAIASDLVTSIPEGMEYATRKANERKTVDAKLTELVTA